MSATESWLLAYVVNALWQVPLVFAVACLVVMRARRMGPAFVHRVWVGALGLQVVLPACHLPTGVLLWIMQSWWAIAPGQAAIHAANVVVTTGAGHVRGGLIPTPWLLQGTLLLFALSLVYFAVRLGVGLVRTAGLRRRADEVSLQGEMAWVFARFAGMFNVVDALVRASREIAGPVTVGVRRRVLLLPQGWDATLQAEDLDAVLAHEFAHMHRWDFAKNLLYEVLSLPLAWHPAVWVTRRRIAESREILCDAMAAEVLQGRQRYARSLLRLAAQFSQTSQATSIHAIGIFDANHFGNFERRVMRLTEKQMEVQGARRVMVVVMGIAAATVVCGSAMALRMQVAAPQTATPQQPTSQPAAFVLGIPKSGNGQPVQTFEVQARHEDLVAPSSGGAAVPVRLRMMTPTEDAPVVQDASQAEQVSAGAMAANVVSKVTPVYPEEAKAQKIQGAVVLDALIGRDGTIKSLKVLSGPNVLAQSAQDAVKQWVYRPYLVNGEPIEVETTVTVTYQLAK